MKLCLLTSTPLNFELGSGTYSGITTLIRALRAAGDEVKLIGGDCSVTTAARIEFNRHVAQLDYSDFDATVGFDLDGYLLPEGSTPHIACVKGVVADEARFESGNAFLELSRQAELERLNLQRADYVITTSRYSAARIRELYGYSAEIGVVPELLDLEEWRRLFASVNRTAAHSAAEGFQFLCVCRFYPRKRLDLLLDAMALIRRHPKGPAIHLRLVGNGVEATRLHDQAGRLQLEDCCTFVGDVTSEQLAQEYLSAGAFVFPSVQEGFGIVLLEAMAAGKAIVTTRSASIPDVTPHALFSKEDTAAGLAGAMVEMAADEKLRARIAACGLVRVRDFDAPIVARQFREQISKVGLRRQGVFSSAGESTSIDPDIAG